MVTESMNNYLEEVKERVNDLLIETGSPQLAFTQYVLDEMCEKANLGETYPCYAVIRNDSNQNVLGELWYQQINTIWLSIDCKAIILLQSKAVATKWNLRQTTTKSASTFMRMRMT